MDESGPQVSPGLVRVRWYLLGLGLAVAAACWQPARKLAWDQRLETMFAPDDPRRIALREWKERFGAGEAVLAVYRDPQLLERDGRGLKRLSAVADRLREVPQVREVLCLADLDRMLAGLAPARRLAGLLRGQAAPEAAPAGILGSDPLAERLRRCFEGYTHSADGTVAALVCLLQPAAEAGTPPPHSAAPAGPTSTAGRQTFPPRQEAVAALAQVLRSLPDGLPPGHLVGEPVLVAEGFALVERDGRRLAWGTTLLVGLVMLACFRSFRWMAAPLLVVQWSILATRGLLASLHFHLSMVSSMLAALLTVIGVATVMHWIVRFRELRQWGLDERTALQQTIALLAGPITLALVTDAIGFGALLASRVAPVRDFGFMMALGSLLVWPAVWLLLPALSLGGRTPRAGAAAVEPPGWLAGWLARSAEWIAAHQHKLAAGLLLAAGGAAAGMRHLELQTDFLSNFRADSSIAQAYAFVETHLGGAGVWDLVVPIPPRLDEATLARVRRLEARLRQIRLPGRTPGTEVPGLTHVLSLVDLVDAAAAEPTLAALAPELRAQALAALAPTFVASLRFQPPSPQETGQLRIMLRARERLDAAQKQQLLTAVEQAAREAFPEGAVATGYYVLLADLVASLLRDQWLSFALAGGGIFLVLLITFRDPWLALGALLPNTLPILVVLGCMGWLARLGLAELKLNMGAAMIAAVSLGLSVDSTLHYLAVYRRARARGQPHTLALTAAQQSVGQAMILSTLALILGFLVLCTSPFVPTAYFGALVSLAMLGGLVGNLLLLPVLLGWLALARQRTWLD